MRVIIALAAFLMLSACGLQPMYANSANSGGPSIVEGLASVEVPSIPGRSGWLVRNELIDRLSAAGQETPRYRLDIALDDSLQGLGVLNDDTISRERYTLRARYQLVDLETDTILLDATAGADAGIDVVSSEFATIAAEQRAQENLSRELADRIVTRIALTLRSAQKTQTP